jgi:multiple RNA-binding domain-containing protein 1
MPTKKQTTKLIVRNVAFEATIHEIRQLFGTFGQLKKVRMPKKFDGKHRGFAFVEFLTEQEALNAFNSLRNSHLYGRHLVLEWATTTTKEEEQEQEQALEVLRIKAKKDYQSLKREEKRLRLTTSYTNEDKSKYDEDM